MNKLNIDVDRGINTLIRYIFYLNILYFLIDITYYYYISVSFMIGSNILLLGMALFFRKFENKVFQNIQNNGLAGKLNNIIGKK